MQYKDILNIEENNTEYIYLYKSGNFYNAVNFSAYALYKLLCNHYRLRIKYIKSLTEYIMIIGGPVNKIEEYISFSGFKYENTGEFLKIYISSKKEELSDFQKVFDNLVDEYKKESEKKEFLSDFENAIKSNENLIIQKIKDFNIGNASIQDFVNFVFELKKLI